MFLVPIICGCAFFTESRYRYFIRRLRSTSFRLTHSYRYFTFQVRECSLSSTKIVQTRAKEACLLFAECSLSYAKIVQTRAKKACLLFAECSLSSTKIVQTRAMKVYFQIAECSLSSTKISILLKLYHLFIEKIWHFYYQKVIFKNKNNLFLL
ncbi:hypothetical protein PrebiDRAFT_1626 [Prevotella bivia DSM 20514]|uniref:Uncharacterized protein n=1 Tax=Prevotella bivia DSM 20514 TaxID=868129 RepID=I4ZAS7_9BACT|nr:hypothetical protein PrebiDRAFT_1626 [Prevotella bivia DSM 20514]